MLSEIIKPRLPVQVVNGILAVLTRREVGRASGKNGCFISRRKHLSRRHSVSVCFVSSRSLCQKCMHSLTANCLFVCFFCFFFSFFLNLLLFGFICFFVRMLVYSRFLHVTSENSPSTCRGEGFSTAR